MSFHVTDWEMAHTALWRQGAIAVLRRADYTMTVVRTGRGEPVASMPLGPYHVAHVIPATSGVPSSGRRSATIVERSVTT